MRLRVAAAVAAVGAVAAGVATFSRRSVSDAVPGDLLLVADVANATGDTMFDKAAQAAVMVGLGQSRRVSLYPRARLRATLERMRFTNLDTVLSYELAQDVAERDRVPLVLGLWLDRDHDGYRLTARLADVRAHRQVFEVSRPARMRDDVIAGMDELLRRTRRALGESRREVADRSAPLPLVTTSSLEALRSYAEGSVAWRAGDYRRAREFFGRAIDLDTGFAMAYGALGNVEYYTHNRDTGERHYAAALSRASRLTEWERLRLLHSQAAFRGQPDSARVISGVIAERFPSAASWYDYGTNLMQGKRYEEAVEVLKRALTFDSLDVNGWVNLATAHKALRRNGDAIIAYRRAETIDAGVLYRNNINHEYGGTLLALNRTAEAESVYRRMTAGSRIADRALGLRSLGLLALWQGRMYEAIGDFQQALEATQQMNAVLSTARNRLWLVAAYRATNRLADANSEVSRTIALANSPIFPPAMLAVLAYACYQLDRYHDVETVVQLIRSRASNDVPSDRASVAIGDALRYLVRQRSDSALVRLRQAGDFNFPIIPMMLTAEAFQSVGERDSAKTTLLAVLDSIGFGAEGQDDYIRAPLVLGEVLLQQGDSVGAANRYRAFIDRWRAAPPDLPDLVTARARLAALTERSRH